MQVDRPKKTLCKLFDSLKHWVILQDEQTYSPTQEQHQSRRNLTLTFMSSVSNSMTFIKILSSTTPVS